jgi:putative ABC transport system permease protein
MNPIIRNLLSVVRRFKLAASLNILGLSVAFAAFMVIMIQLDYDHSFDKFHKDSDKIFRVEIGNQAGVFAILSRPMAEHFFESSPHIIAGTICEIWPGDAFFHVENNGVRNFYKEKQLKVSPGFSDVFTFDIVEGADDALKTPNNVLIPLSLSRKLFGNESAVGQQLVYEWGNQTVGAIYRDFPANSVITNCIYRPMPENENKDSWGNQNYTTYIRVNDAANVPQLFDNFKRNAEVAAAFAAAFGGGGATFDWDEIGLFLRFTALPDIHFITGVQYDSTPKAGRQTLMILFAIAIVIIAIAAINFTNFSTALTPMRVKSINTQRVLGARQSTLRRSLLFEAVFTGFLSYFVALLLVLLFNNSPLAKLVDADLSLAAHPLIVGGTALVALLTGLLAGMYPSRYMTSFAPALVLKGNFALSPKGRKLRNTLIGIQYVASIALIIGASFMYLQNRFMQTSSLGYDKEALITVNVGQIQKSRDAFTNQIKAYAGVEDVTYAHALLSSADSYMKWGQPYKGEPVTFQCLPIQYTFLKVMGIEVAEGRDFRQGDENTEHGAWIFNETAQKQLNLELNTNIDNGGEIIGFMPDIKIASFRTAVEPMAFTVFGTENSGWDFGQYV